MSDISGYGHACQTNMNNQDRLNDDVTAVAMMLVIATKNWLNVKISRKIKLEITIKS